MNSPSVEQTPEQPQMRGVGSSDSSVFRLSLVIEYPNKNAAPAIGRQECLGGTIVALQFSDALSEIEHLRETLAHLQHYTSCTSTKFDLIEAALAWPNASSEPCPPPANQPPTNHE